jgi:hypothetical protein
LDIFFVSCKSSILVFDQRYSKVCQELYMPIANISYLNRGVASYGKSSRGGITSPKRLNPQFIFSRSYGTTIHGDLAFWDNEAQAGRWREFWLDSMYINNQLVISTDEILINAEPPFEYTYRDDGFGLSISDYADAINTKLSANNLKSRIYTGAGNEGPIGLAAMIDPEEDFEFNFYDISTNGTPGLDPSGFFKLKAVQGRIWEGVVFSPGAPPILSGTLYSLPSSAEPYLFDACAKKIALEGAPNGYGSNDGWPYP